MLMNSSILIVVVWQNYKSIIQFCFTKINTMMEKEAMDFFANSGLLLDVIERPILSKVPKSTKNQELNRR
jgi:hypothetical protein